MGEARRRRTAGVAAARPPRERIWAGLSPQTVARLREAHARLTAAQREAGLPAASWDAFLEGLLVAGLDRLAQTLAGPATPPEPPRIVTPAQAERELVMADAVQNQYGRRTLGGPPMFLPARPRV